MTHVDVPGNWAFRPAPDPGPPPVFVRPGRRLRPVGALAQVALFGCLLTSLALGWEVKSRLDIFNRAIGRPPTATLGDVNQADQAVHNWAVADIAVTIVTLIVFVTWFFLARLSAERHNPDVLRFGRGWAIGAWITPIMSLWRPYQMTNDVLAASELPPGARVWERHSYRLITAWWAALVVAGLVTRLTSGSMDSPSAVRRISSFEIVDSVLWAVAAVLAILVVGRIVGANDRRRAALLADAGIAR